MDRVKETANAVISLNRFQNKEINSSEFITVICKYFDLIKNLKISEADKKFLIYVANKVGIPHYFDMLKIFQSDINLPPEEINLSSLASFIYESSLQTSDNIKVHQYQKEILEKFDSKKQNRYFLSASTSFGKTFLVYEIVKKMKYKNVMLIFPTIALLSENLERLRENYNYSYFEENYSIHTLSDAKVEENVGNNLFIYTPERFLSFLDKNNDKPQLDFIFVDEVYKIDNEYLIDESVKESERDVAYRLALFFAFKKYKSIDALLTGPYISFFSKNDPEYNPSFDNFLEKFSIKLINKNDIEIVNKVTVSLTNRPTKTIAAGDLNFNFNGKTSKVEKLHVILSEIINKNENAIIYCYSKAATEFYALKIIESNISAENNFEHYVDFIQHIQSNLHKEWIVVKALKHGIGIHHGLVPKYMQKEIINLFNNSQLKFLISTTTITEGVNTTAKNLIVLHYKKGTKELKPFDAKNIEGRAGRFMQHYSGRVLTLEKEFNKIIKSEEIGIKHKNYDRESPKDDLDLEITDDKYLSKENKIKRKNIIDEQSKRNIPEEIISQYKAISKQDKIIVFDGIKSLTDKNKDQIIELIRKTNYERPEIDYDGFQVVIDTIEPIVKDKDLKWLLGKSDWNRKEPDPYSRLTHKLYWYLKDDFKGAFYFNHVKLKQSVDKAMREASKFIFNTLKYQTVKYLGVFNLMYKLERSQALNRNFEDILGIDRLLTKLEYNAFNNEARIVSDYGAPYNVVKYFDSEASERSKIALEMDKYEKNILAKMELILKK